MRFELGSSCNNLKIKISVGKQKRGNVGVWRNRQQLIFGGYDKLVKNVDFNLIVMENYLVVKESIFLNDFYGLL